MKRGFILIIPLLITSIACGFLSTSTQTVSPTGVPSQPVRTKLPVESSTPAAVAATQTPIAATSAASTPEEPTKRPYPTSVLDAQMSADVKLIQSQVIEERDLQPVSPVPVVLLSPDELRQNVINDFLVDYSDEEMANDVLELTIIGLLDPGFDLSSFYTELLSEQVAGYYDNEMGEMFVVKGKGFEGPEHLTYAHEYTHVLQDQNYDIENGLKYNDDSCDVDTERCAAVQALIEGDATLSEFTWFQKYASTNDQQQIIEYINSLQSPIYDSAPAFMQDDFVFPYLQGLDFVQSFFDRGGWSAVDAVFENPPVSTEQILHPSQYPADIPIPVDLPDLVSILGDGWREVSRNQMGEWYTFLILARSTNAAARLDDATAQDAAAGWGGDEYLVLHNDTRKLSAFVLKTVWDKNGEASQFADAFKQYADARFGISSSQEGDLLTWSYPDGYSSFFHSADTTIWIVAPDTSIALAISDSVLP